MAPLLWILGGVVIAEVWKRRHHTATPGAPAKGVMTPQRAAIAGNLMANCCDPQKLQRAAVLFGQEGLTQEAQAFLSKAAMIHQMMHGAKEIVERSRDGDQHCIAMAKAIGENAAAGDKKAQISAFLIQQYTAQHPNQRAA